MALRRWLWAVVVLGWVGCGGNDDGGGTPSPSPQPQATARVRLVHASPDAPAVDVYVQGQGTPVFTNVAYTQTTPYQNVPEGSVTFEVRQAGSPASSPPVFTSPPLSFTRDTTVTAVAAGKAFPGPNEPALRILALQEGFATPGANEVRARLVHAAVDAPAVSVDVGDDGTAEVPSLAPFADTGPQGAALPAGQALQVAVGTAGATPQRVTAFTSPALPAGASLFVVAIGRLAADGDAPDGFALLAVGPDGTVGVLRQNPVVYTLHVSPDAPAVDVFVGDSEILSNLDYGGLSGLQGPPGKVTFDVFPTSSGTTRPSGRPAASAELDLQAGQVYLATASGFVQGVGSARPPLTLQAYASDFTPPAAGKARVRVVHNAPDAPAVDVGTVTNLLLDVPVAFNNLAYPNASAPEGVEVPAQALTLGVAPAGTRTPLATFAVTPEAGQRYFAVAAGAVTARSGEQHFGLLLIDATPTPGLTPWELTPLRPQ